MGKKEVIRATNVHTIYQALQPLLVDPNTPEQVLIEAADQIVTQGNDFYQEVHDEAQACATLGISSGSFAYLLILLDRIDKSLARLGLQGALKFKTMVHVCSTYGDIVAIMDLDIAMKDAPDMNEDVRKEAHLLKDMRDWVALNLNMFDLEKRAFHADDVPSMYQMLYEKLRRENTDMPFFILDEDGNDIVMGDLKEKGAPDGLRELLRRLLDNEDLDSDIQILGPFGSGDDDED